MCNRIILRETGQGRAGGGGGGYTSTRGSNSLVPNIIVFLIHVEVVLLKNSDMVH